MRMWIPHISAFRYVIWSKLTTVVLVEYLSTENNNNDDDMVFHLNIPFELFQTFGFIDETGFCTTLSGNGVRRRVGFYNNVQRSFYSGYFGHHGG